MLLSLVELITQSSNEKQGSLVGFYVYPNSQGTNFVKSRTRHVYAIACPDVGLYAVSSYCQQETVSLLK